MADDKLEQRVKALEDRYEVEEFILSYFGYGDSAPHGDYVNFYDEDPFLDLNGRVCTVKADIPALYRQVGSYFPRLTGKYHMQITNFIIRVDGDSAKVNFLWTQQINESVKGVPRFTEQGREYDHLVRVDGQWKFKKRVVISDSGLLDCFDDIWQPRYDQKLEDA